MGCVFETCRFLLSFHENFFSTRPHGNSFLYSHTKYFITERPHQASHIQIGLIPYPYEGSSHEWEWGLICNYLKKLISPKEYKGNNMKPPVIIFSWWMYSTAAIFPANSAMGSSIIKEPPFYHENMMILLGAIVTI